MGEGLLPSGRTGVISSEREEREEFGDELYMMYGSSSSSSAYGKGMMEG